MADHKIGFLVVDVGGEAVEHPPVYAKRRVAVACPAAATLDVGAVKAAYPDPVEWCPGVTVRAQDPV